MNEFLKTLSKEELNHIAMLKIQQFHIYELLKRKISELN